MVLRTSFFFDLAEGVEEDVAVVEATGGLSIGWGRGAWVAMVIGLDFQSKGAAHMRL